jgi:pyridoxal phosphate enzyme (YggS family)
VHFKKRYAGNQCFFNKMDNIKDNLEVVQERIHRACQRSHCSSSELKLVAVTKEVSTETVKKALALGIRDFGENTVQEASRKITDLATVRPELTWHMMGHLQSNKARQAGKLFDIIHSINTVKLAQILDKQAEKIIPVLLQVNIAGEPTKSGFAPEALETAIAEMRSLSSLKIKGLMTIAPLSDNPEKSRPIFKKLRLLRDKLKLEHLSMGMSDDFEIAVEEGATILRIGRAIFGERRS